MIWRSVYMRRWFDREGGLLPPKIENLMGPVLGLAMERGVDAVNGQPGMTSQLATATLGDMLTHAAVLLRDDLQRKVLEVASERMAAAWGAGSQTGPGLDVLQMGAWMFIHVLMTYCTPVERGVVEKAMPCVQHPGLMTAFRRQRPPNVARWAQVVGNLRGDGIEMTEEAARQHWHRAWDKILPDAKRLEMLLWKLQEAEYYEDPDRLVERFWNYPMSLRAWKEDKKPTSRLPLRMGRVPVVRGGDSSSEGLLQQGPSRGARPIYVAAGGPHVRRQSHSQDLRDYRDTGSRRGAPGLRFQSRERTSARDSGTVTDSP
jgi:hypothetical protein